MEAIVALCVTTSEVAVGNMLEGTSTGDDEDLLSFGSEVNTSKQFSGELGSRDTALLSVTLSEVIAGGGRILGESEFLHWISFFAWDADKFGVSNLLSPESSTGNGLVAAVDRGRGRRSCEFMSAVFGLFFSQVFVYEVKSCRVKFVEKADVFFQEFFFALGCQVVAEMLWFLWLSFLYERSFL